MPREEDSEETRVVKLWIEHLKVLQEDLAGYTTEELHLYFDPLEEDKAPPQLYAVFENHRYDWDEVDWDVIQECVEELTGVYVEV